MMTKEKLLSTHDLLRHHGLTDESHAQEVHLFTGFERAIRATYEPRDTQRIIRATHLMIHAHIEQRYGTKPYIVHPLEVALNVHELCEELDPEAVIAALFHDVVEDQSRAYLEKTGRIVTDNIPTPTQALEAIKEDFGDDVASSVGSLTNPDFVGQLKDEGIDTSHPDFPRKFRALYAKHVARAIDDPRVCLIKFSDFTRNNGQGLVHMPDGPTKRRLAEKYRPVVDIFTARIKDDTRPLNTTQQAAMLLELEEIAADIDDYLG